MKFTFAQRTTDYYVVEADSEEEAYDLVCSGEVDVAHTNYNDDIKLINTEE